MPFHNLDEGEAPMHIHFIGAPNLLKTLRRTTRDTDIALVPAAEAAIIVADHWVPPADATKSYVYWGPHAMRDLAEKGLKEVFAYDALVKLPRYDNAYYLHFLHIPTAFPAIFAPLVKDVAPVTPCVVVVDDAPAHLEAAKRAIPNAVTFTRAEDAIAFLQLNARPVIAVLTDLVMVVSEIGRSQRYEEKPDVSGILVVMAARRRSIPVVVVTRGHYISAMEEYFRNTFVHAENIPILEPLTEKNEAVWTEALNLAK